MNSYWDWLPVEIQLGVLRFCKPSQTIQNQMELIHDEIKLRRPDFHHDSWPMPCAVNRFYENCSIKQVKDSYGCVRYVRPVFRYHKTFEGKVQILKNDLTYMQDYQTTNNPNMDKDTLFCVDITSAYIIDGNHYYTIVK